MLLLLEEALEAKILLEEGSGSSIAYHFRHPLLQNRLYETISSTRQAMLHRQLAGALAGLATADRDAILLVADGLSYAEAAQALGVPAGTLSSRLARARRKLREGLGGMYPAEKS